jgi:cytochrome P450
MMELVFGRGGYSNSWIPFSTTLLVFASSATIISHSVKRKIRSKPKNEIVDDLLNTFPICPGLPYFGRVFDFVRAPVKFLLTSEEKYGSVFGFTLMGKNVIFLTKPKDMRKIWNLPDQYATAVDNGFKHVMIMSQSRYDWFMREKCNKQLHHCMVQGFSGSKLASLNSRVAKALQNNLEIEVTQNTPKKLYDFTSRLLYNVIAQTLAGSKFDSTKHYQDYLQLDAGFHLIISGYAPSFYPVLANARAAQLRLGKAFYDCFNSEDCSPLMKDMGRIYSQTGMSQLEQELMLGVKTWAMHANTAAVTFWMLTFLMNEDEAMLSLEQELDVYAEKHPNWWTDANGISSHVNNLHVLKSCYKETLRLLSATLFGRDCVQDVDVELENGTTIHLKVGDRILMYPTWHHSNEVFSNASKFQHDRFVDQNKKFFLDGIELKEPVAAFGGGLTKCPGFSLVENEVPLFVAIILTKFGLSFDNDNKQLSKFSKIPPFNMAKFGLGSFSPAHDIDFYLKRKAR